MDATEVGAVKRWWKWGDFLETGRGGAVLGGGLKQYGGTGGYCIHLPSIFCIYLPTVDVYLPSSTTSFTKGRPASMCRSAPARVQKVLLLVCTGRVLLVVLPETGGPSTTHYPVSRALPARADRER